MNSAAKFLAILFVCLTFQTIQINALFKLLDTSPTSLVSNPKPGVVYLFQLARTSTVPNYAPLNLKTETWLKLSGIPFYRLSCEFLLGGPLGTVPFALYNGKYFDSSDKIIEEIGKMNGKYTEKAEEKKLRQKIDNALFKIVVLDRISTNAKTEFYGYDWAVKDEGIIEQAIPLFVPKTQQKQTIKIDAQNYEIMLDSAAWTAYFGAFNSEENETKIAFLNEYLVGNKSADGKLTEFNVEDFGEFDGQIRNLIERTMKGIFGSGGQLEAKLDAYLNSHNYSTGINWLAGNGSAKSWLKLKSNGIAILKELKKTLAPIYARLAKSKAKFPEHGPTLFGGEFTPADASLFGSLVQFLEVELANPELIEYFGDKKGDKNKLELLHEFVDGIKLRMGFGGQKWENLTKKPWSLNFEEKKFDPNNLTEKFDGPFTLVTDSLLELFNEDGSLNEEERAKSPAEVQAAIQAIQKAANSSNELNELLRVMAAYLCNLGGKNTAKTGKIYAKLHNDHGISDPEIIVKGRKLAYSAVVAYNEGLIKKKVLKAYVAANGLNSPDELGNEF